MSAIALVVAFPNQMDPTQLEACATQACQGVEPHGAGLPAIGTALTAIGKNDGGLYTPCETISLAMAGGDDQTEYLLYATSGTGVPLATSNNGAVEVTAPISGTLYLLGMRANNQVRVTYETITLNSDGNVPPGGVCPQPPPPPPPPPYIAPPPYTAPPPPPPYGSGSVDEQLATGTPGGVGTSGAAFFVGMVLGVALVFVGLLYLKRKGKPLPAWLPLAPPGWQGPGPTPAAASTPLADVKSASMIAVSVGGGGGAMGGSPPPIRPPPPDGADATEQDGLPDGWTVEMDGDRGREYYYNTRTGETSWTKPTG